MKFPSRRESLVMNLCSSKARHFLVRYMPNKPHKYGFVLYVLSGMTGFAYNFVVYSGQENDECNRAEDEPDLGSTGNLVVRLARVVPKHKNHKIYFDITTRQYPYVSIYSHKGTDV